MGYTGSVATLCPAAWPGERTCREEARLKLDARLLVRQVTPVLAVLFAVLTLLDARAAVQPGVLRVGFVPTENMVRLSERAQPLTQELRRHLGGTRVVPFVASDYTGVIEAMKARKIDVAFFSPGAYVLAEKQARARSILRVVRGGRNIFYSSIITHRDSGIRTLADLRGKRFAFGDLLSLSGALYPRLMLLEAGLDPKRDFRQVRWAGSHDLVVLAVLHREVDAGATFANDDLGRHGAWHQFLRRPDEVAQIRPLAFSKPLPSDNVAVRDDLPPALVARLRTAFVSMSRTPVGKRLLWELYHIDGFVNSTPQDYAPVREVYDRVGIDVR